MSSDSVLSGGNLAFLEGLYADYRRDPGSIDPSWLPLFRDLGLTSGNGYHPPVVHTAVAGTNDLTAAEPAAQGRVDDLIHSYRLHGHLRVDLDPLGLMGKVETPSLDFEYHGFTKADLDRQFDPDTLPLGAKASLREIIDTLKDTYCRDVGVEYMHLVESKERQWLQTRMEAMKNRLEFTPAQQERILTKLSYGDGFETFLHKKYVGARRFSLSGAEVLIPMLDTLIERATEMNAREVVLGMAHRGRLNVLTNIFDKRPTMMFSEFEHNHDPWANLGTGDVKYHLGFSSDHQTSNGRQIHLTMGFNPSHLEFIDPVIEGRVRAKQDRRADDKRETVLPVLIHGDAAFMGQGVVMETLNLAGLDGYTTGGTIHIVLNNQIGFTTQPSDSRSAPYCTEIAKFTVAPIFHVNADRPEACVYLIELAMEFRQKFHRDVVIDIVCYRRYGHNEGDEPSFTQPIMYKAIRNQAPVREQYAKSLIDHARLSQEQVDLVTQKCMVEFGQAFDEARAKPPADTISTGDGVWKPYTAGPDADLPEADTTVTKSKLRDYAQAMTTAPSDFELHPKVKKLLETRRAMGTGEVPLDWAMGELLAFASLVDGGTHVRMSGQDVRRGTFSSRHSIVVCQNTGRVYTPIAHLRDGQPPFEITDSPLSEVGVLGFEFGYSLDSPDALVVWEAQFGDFSNVAQVIIDQFISSSAAKWKRLSGLVMMLPHGYEGQGPEHSSARLERFLQISAAENMQVCNLTTPAQIFHVLRRQVLRSYRKPLILMTPKSLLRHPLATSTLADLSAGGFQRVIDDPQPKANKVKRVILCTGKVYYDLFEERQKRSAEEVAIVRVEQLYPYPEAQLVKALAAYKNMEHLLWVQEEPENMGAASFIFPLLTRSFGDKLKIQVVARQPGASPATGAKESHDLEQKLVIGQAFGDQVPTPGRQLAAVPHIAAQA